VVRTQIARFLHPGIGIGLLAAVSAGMAGVLDTGFFKALWFAIPLGPLGELDIGTPVIFGLGVFTVVVCVATSYLLGLNRVAEGTGQ